MIITRPTLIPYVLAFTLPVESIPHGLRLPIPQLALA